MTFNEEKPLTIIEIITVLHCYIYDCFTDEFPDRVRLRRVSQRVLLRARSIDNIVSGQHSTAAPEAYTLATSGEL